VAIGFVSETDLLELFEDVPASCMAMLEESSCLMDVPPGHVFFRVGQPAEAVFLLESGSVRTLRIFAGRKISIATLRPPALFGEMGCFGEGRYYYCAECIQNSRVRLISRDAMQALLDCAPNLAHGIIDLIGERFARFLHKLETHAVRATLPRLASLLLEKAEEDVVRGLTHKDFANELGVHRESVTAALSELRKAGIIRTGRKTIRVLQFTRLERASRE
jgi:CRP/FNR family transcriptional regulator, cyclic AMP receptor protein